MASQGTATAATSVAISLNTTAGTLNPSQTQSFTATVTGSTNTAVTWSLNPGVGSIAASGNTVAYTAPALVSNAQSITITATSKADTTKIASAVIKLAPALNISPLSATLTNSQSISLNTTGANTNGVVWSFSPAIGTLVQNGTTAVYTVPSSLSQSQTIQVQATSVSTSTLIARAMLVLVPTVAVSMTPPSTDLLAGEQIVLNPMVSGSTNTAVRWSLSPNLGTIDSTGLYTAPTDLVDDTTVTITALAQADSTKMAQSSVRVHPNGIYFRTNANGLQSLIWNGMDYNYVYGEGLLSYVYEPNSTGSTAQYTPKCMPGPFTVNSVTGKTARLTEIHSR